MWTANAKLVHRRRVQLVHSRSLKCLYHLASSHADPGGLSNFGGNFADVVRRKIKPFIEMNY